MEQTPKNITNQQLEALICDIATTKNKDAFVALYTQWAAKLKAYAIRCGSSESEAEEVVQESLLTIWRKAETFNPEIAQANTWIYTIVRNKRIDLLRKNKLLAISSDDLWPEGEPVTAHDHIESDLNLQAVRIMLDTLPDEQKQIVLMVYFEGKSHSEIAAELDLPLGTIKSRLRLAMKKLDTLAKEHMTWLIIIQLMNI